MTIPDRNLRLALLASMVREKRLPKPNLQELARLHPPTLDDPEEDDADYVYNDNLAVALAALVSEEAKLAELRVLEWDPDRELMFAIWPQFDGESEAFEIQELTGLAACTALERCALSAMGSVEDFSPLAGLSNLRELHITHARDLRFAAQLAKLRELVVDGPIESLAPLQDKPDLERLTLHGVRVTDVAVLASLPKLKRLEIRWDHGAPGPRREAAKQLVETLTSRAVELDVEWPSGPVQVARKRTKAARNPALEAPIIADPDDEAAHLVYADWLQSEGDPLGLLIALDHKLLHDKSPELVEARRAHFVTHKRAFLGKAKDRDDYVWWLGLIRGARNIAHDDDLAELLAAPAARFLASLHVHELRGNEIIGALCAANPRPPLLSLELLQDTNHAFAGGVWPGFPKLQRLVLRGDDLSVGTLDLPELRELDVGASTLEVVGDLLEAVTQQRWPKLEELRLGELFRVAKLDSILRGDDLPALRRLRLGTVKPDELCVALAGAPVIERLVELDITSREGITEAGATALLDASARFEHLEVFDFTIGKLPAEKKQALLAMKRNAPKRTGRPWDAANGSND